MSLAVQLLDLCAQYVSGAHSDVFRTPAVTSNSASRTPKIGGSLWARCPRKLSMEIGAADGATPQGKNDGTKL